MITKIKVKDLTKDYKLQLEDGNWCRISSIKNGMYRSGKLITYSNGQWSNLLDSDIVDAMSVN